MPARPRLPDPGWLAVGPDSPPAPIDAPTQMALDEVLLDEVAAGRRAPTIRFWRWTERALVLGSHQSVANEVDGPAAAARGYRVVRRMSGGGTMVCEPGGTVTYSMYLPEALVAGLSFVESFAYLDAWMVAALRDLGVPAAYQPINDIVSPAGKIAGAAQARRRGAVLHHTTAAFATDPAVVPRLIRIGRPRIRQLGLRSAEKVVTPLAGFVGLDLDQLVDRLARAAGGVPSHLGPEVAAAADRLARDKYATQEWTLRIS